MQVYFDLNIYFKVINRNRFFACTSNETGNRQITLNRHTHTQKEIKFYFQIVNLIYIRSFLLVNFVKSKCHIVNFVFTPTM